MIKKFLIKLVGFREVARGQTPFHQREQIERELAEERRQQVQQNEAERLRNQRVPRQEPSDSEILGPSDSALKGEKQETSE